MVVITIIGIISLASYMPYAHHQKKVAIKTAAREISQSLSSSRNLAINGFNTGSGNVNVWLYFASWAQTLSTYTSTWTLNLSNITSANLYGEKHLPVWMKIDSIDGMGWEFLFVFDAISWSGSTFPISSSEIVPIQISFKWASSPTLQHKIEYYKASYISDY